MQPIGAAPGDPYLPLRELAGYAGLSVRTLRTYLVHPATPLPHYRIGGKLLVRRSDYDAWASKFRATAPARIVDDAVSELLEGII